MPRLMRRARNQDGTPDDDPSSPAELSLAGGYRMSAGCTKSGILLIAVRIRASRFSGCLAKKSRSSGYQRPTQPTTGKTP